MKLKFCSDRVCVCVCVCERACVCKFNLPATVRKEPNPLWWGFRNKCFFNYTACAPVYVRVCACMGVRVYMHDSLSVCVPLWVCVCVCVCVCGWWGRGCLREFVSDGRRRTPSASPHAAGISCAQQPSEQCKTRRLTSPMMRCVSGFGWKI